MVSDFSQLFMSKLAKINYHFLDIKIQQVLKQKLLALIQYKLLVYQGFDNSSRFRVWVMLMVRFKVQGSNPIVVSVKVQVYGLDDGQSQG